MKICKLCNTENDVKNEYCSYCGGVLKFPKAYLFLLVGLFCWPVLIIGLYLYFKDYKKIKEIQKENNINMSELIKKFSKKNKKENINKPINTDFTVKSYFLGTEYLRKKDGKVERGDCEIIIKNDNFYIKQNDEVIENYLASVYALDIWKYKDNIYFKFEMNSKKVDYKFCSQNFEIDKIADYIIKNDIAIEIEDNR